MREVSMCTHLMNTSIKNYLLKCVLKYNINFKCCTPTGVIVSCIYLCYNIILTKNIKFK